MLPAALRLVVIAVIREPNGFYTGHLVKVSYGNRTLPASRESGALKLTDTAV